MSLSDQSSPDNAVIPLPYLGASAAAGEMVWIVRFVAGYLLAHTLLGAATHIYYLWEVSRSFNQTVWLSWLMSRNTVYMAFQFCAAILIAAMMWRLRREAFWGLLAIGAMPGSYDLFAQSQNLLRYIAALPSTMIVLAIVWTVYRRAGRRGVLSPASGGASAIGSPTADLRWFMGLLGLWVLTSAVEWISNVSVGRWGGFSASSGDFPTTNLVHKTGLAASVLLGLWLVIRRSHRVLPCLAFLTVACTVAMEFAVWRDFSLKPGLAGQWKPTFQTWAHSLMIAGFTMTVYIHARRALLDSDDERSVLSSRMQEPRSL